MPWRELPIAWLPDHPTLSAEELFSASLRAGASLAFVSSAFRSVFTAAYLPAAVVTCVKQLVEPAF